MAALFPRKQELKEKYGERIPPGQTATEKWPVLHFDEAPQVDLESWKFRVFGEVEEEIEFNYQEFTSMPAVDVSCDIHCVTHWSRMDNRSFLSGTDEAGRLNRHRFTCGYPFRN